MDAQVGTFVLRRSDETVAGWGARFPDGAVVVHWCDGGTEIFGALPAVELLRSSSGEPDLALHWHAAPAAGGGGVSVLASALHRGDGAPSDAGGRQSPR
jgi:hypothetical protein